MYVCMYVHNYQRGEPVGLHTQRETPTMQFLEVKIYIYFIQSPQAG